MWNQRVKQSLSKNEQLALFSIELHAYIELKSTAYKLYMLQI